MAGPVAVAVRLPGTVGGVLSVAPPLTFTLALVVFPARSRAATW